MAGLLCLKQNKQSSIWLSILQILSVPDEGNSRNVPDEGNSRNIPDGGNSRNIPDEGNSRNASCALHWISTFLFWYK